MSASGGYRGQVAFGMLPDAECHRQAPSGTGRHRQAPAGTGRHWQALAGTGRHWQALAGTGRHWQALSPIVTPFLVTGSESRGRPHS